MSPANIVHVVVVVVDVSFFLVLFHLYGPSDALVGRFLAGVLCHLAHRRVACAMWYCWFVCVCEGGGVCCTAWIHEVRLSDG